MNKPDPKKMDVHYDDRKVIVNPHVSARLLQDEIDKMKVEAEAEKKLKAAPLQERARKAYDALVKLHCEQQRLWGMLPSQKWAEEEADKAIRKAFVDLQQEERNA